MFMQVIEKYVIMHIIAHSIRFPIVCMYWTLSHIFFYLKLLNKFTNEKLKIL